MADDTFTAELTKASEKDVERYLQRLLQGTRRESKNIVKDLARMASNSAARLTIPKTEAGGKGVRRPKLKDKFRPLKPAKKFFHGNFYLVKGDKANSGKRRNKKKKRFTGFTASGESRVMSGTKGELVIYTKKKISQKDKRLKKLNMVLEVWDRKKKSLKWIPSVAKSSAKYDRASKMGKIPHYFTAKQAWIYSVAPINRTRTMVLNPRARNYGRFINRLDKRDNPSVVLQNRSNYVLKRGGRLVPQRALTKALRGFGHRLEKSKRKIVNKAKK